MALIPAVEAAMARGDADSAELTALLALAGSRDEACESVEHLLDRLEDTLSGLCKQMDEELRGRLLINRQDLREYCSRNLDASYKAAAFYNDTIAPALKNYRELAKGNEDRLVRAKAACATVLGLLGMGWEWACQYITAEQTLEMALELARATPAEPTILKELARVRPLADRERAGAQYQVAGVWPLTNGPTTTPSKPQPVSRPAGRKPAKNQSRAKIGASLVGGILFAISRLFTTFSGTDSSQPPSNPPSYTYQDLQRNMEQYQRDHTHADPAGNDYSPDRINPEADSDPSTLGLSKVKSWGDYLKAITPTTQPTDTFGESNREH
jgi:hypothetical protein